MIKATKTENVHSAKARLTNLSVSTKHSIEISKYLRYKKVSAAKVFLENVVLLKSAVPFKTHNMDMGHKRGIGPGRYPTKAAKEFLTLLKSVESNAQDKGLNTDNLKISKLIANKASIPMTGGRHRQATKRTHLEVEVIEGKEKKKSVKPAKKKAESKSEVPKVEKKAEEKVEVKTEVKEEAKTEDTGSKDSDSSTKSAKPVVEKQEEVKTEEVAAQ